jgi:hypothetical protein
MASNDRSADDLPSMLASISSTTLDGSLGESSSNLEMAPKWRFNGAETELSAIFREQRSLKRTKCKKYGS